ncbi:Predicted arabinose efflux permease, MFS family [Micromonospora haikouensis]|uniref:Predicted arabinose efflux permease, MFS family n=1 Tax=Micromonospora haikouensis TaxID=686309 RepID=A0A1C4V6E7_9ACTN|nr:MFS transporter [Micromonospora haikouensis]SCE79295.1 Predicted arabinose efflux permease, MFS family [Micromonospora haikouensis]
MTDNPARAVPRPALVGIFGGLFAGYLGLTAVIPVLPAFLRDRHAAGDLVVGLVVTVTAGTALLVRPVAGALADRYGHRTVMLTGALVAALGGLLYFLPLAVPALVAVRLLLGAGEAALFTAGAVWTVALAPHHRRGQLIGLYGVSMWGGISAGTFLGATLQQVSFTAVWALAAAAPLLAAALIALVPVPHGEPGTAAPQEPGTAAQREPGTAAQRKSGGGGGLLLRPALLPGTALALGAAGYAGLAAFVVLHLDARGIGSGVLVLSCFSAVYAGTRLVIGHLPDKLGPRRVAAWSAAGEAVGLTIVALAPNLPVAVAGGVVTGVGFSLLHPSLALMVMNRADPTRQGAAIGAYTSFWDLGLAVWGPVTGLVAATLDYPAVFGVGAACAVAAAAMAAWIGRPTGGHGGTGRPGKPGSERTEARAA